MALIFSLKTTLATDECINKLFCVLDNMSKISLRLAMVSLSEACSLKLVQRQPTVANYF